MTQIAGVDLQKFKEIQYNILADALRKHMDISRIMKLWKRGQMMKIELENVLPNGKLKNAV